MWITIKNNAGGQRRVGNNPSSYMVEMIPTCCTCEMGDAMSCTGLVVFPITPTLLGEHFSEPLTQKKVMWV